MSTDRGDFREFDHGETLADGNCDAAWYDSLVGALGFRFTSSYAFGAAGDDPRALMRVFCLANRNRPSSGTSTFVIDDTEDWRDRIFLLFGVRNATNIIPGSSSDADLAAAENSTVGYTGTGEAAGQASLPGYGKSISTTGWWIYADLTTGALKIDVPSGASSAKLSGVFQIMAGPQLDAKVAVTEIVAMPSATDTESVTASQLNMLQDASIMSQAIATDADTLPLGPECRGNPPIAEEWTVRGEVVRQPVAGQAWRYFTMALGATEERTIDSSVDWRDRLVTVFGLADPSADFLPGDAGDATVSETDAASYQSVSFYTGPGAATPSGDYTVDFTGAGNLRLFADEDDGSLVVVSDAAFVVNIVGVIMATPQLGPRSVNR